MLFFSGMLWHRDLLAMAGRLFYYYSMKNESQVCQVKGRSYLDWAATAIPDEKIQDAFMSLGPNSGKGIMDYPYWGNPSSLHAEGRAAREALENARSRCARILGVLPETLYFTSGGTESNALILHSLLQRKGKLRLLYSGTEHPSVRGNCLKLERLNIPIGVIGTEKDGRVSEGTLSRALEKYADTRFIAVMGVNNETGSLTEIQTLVSLVRSSQKQSSRPVHFHSDLVQALGKVPMDLSGWDLDSAAFSAHKLGGPRGIGLLYLKKSVETLYSGGEQERGIRPGTENTMGAIALSQLLERRADPEIVRVEEENARNRFKYLISELRKINRCALIPEDREEEDLRFSPWILQARFRDIPGAVMVRALDDEGVAVSTGSACSSMSPERPVLAAMGVDKAGQIEGIRISQGWSTDISAMDALLSAVKKVLSYL